MSGKKGARYMRQARNSLESVGYAVLPSPASGAGTSHHLPDYCVGNAEHELLLAVELKGKKGDLLYLHEWEVAALEHFSHRFGADPAIAVRWHGDTTVYYALVEDVEYSTERARSTRFRVRKDESTQNWKTTETLHEILNDASDE